MPMTMKPSVNIPGIGENAAIRIFCLSAVFSAVPRHCIIIPRQNKMFSWVFWNHPDCLSVCVSVRVSVYVQNTSFCQSAGRGINSVTNQPWFSRVCSTSLLKILLEKEKLLVTSNFSFSHSVFYWFGELSAIFFKFEIVVCKPFQFERI